VARSCDSIRILLLFLAFSPCVATAEGPTTKPDIFEDRAEELGIDFAHFAGVSGEFYIVEITGPGCDMLDYDNDGDLDLYLIQGEMLGPGKTAADADQPPRSTATARRFWSSSGVSALRSGHFPVNHV